MANELLDFPSYADQPERKPLPREATFGEALGAQYGSVFGDIIHSNKTYAAPSYEEGAAEAVDALIESRSDLTNEEKNKLLQFGTSSKTIKDTVAHIDLQRARQKTVESLSGPTAFFSDPALGIDLMLMASAVGAPFVVGKTLGSLGMRAGAQGLKDTTSRVLTARGVGAIEAGKIGAAYGAASPLILGTVETLSAAGQDSEKELSKAVASTLGFAALGAVAGYGISRALGVATDSVIAPVSSNFLSNNEIAEAKLKASVDQVFKRKKAGDAKSAKELARQQRREASRAKHNAEMAKNYNTYLDDMSGDEIAGDIPAVGYKNEGFLRFITGAVPTPLRNIVNSNLPDGFKSAAMKLGADMGLVTKANEQGIPSEISVHLKKAMRSKTWSKSLSVIDEAYREVNPRRSQTFMGTQIFNSVEVVRKAIGKDAYTLGDWYELVGKTTLRQTPVDQIESEPLKRAVIAYRDFIEPYTKELEDLGMINSRELFIEKATAAASRQGDLINVSQSIIQANRRWMNAEIAKLGNRTDAYAVSASERLSGLLTKLDEAKSFDDLMALRSQLDLTFDMAQGLDKLKQGIDDLAEQIDSYKQYIDTVDADPKSRVHFPLVYNRKAIRASREAFEAKLRAHFKANNTITVFDQNTNKFQKVELATDPASIEQRARQATDTILDEVDDDDIEMMTGGMGRSGMLGPRRIGIDPSLIEDFIVTDVRDLMIAYSDRVGGKIDFHRAFANPQTGKAQAFDDILEQLRIAARSEGASQEEVEAGIKDFVGLYDTVVGIPLKNPDRWDAKTAEILRSLTNMTFLGRAGIAAIGDASSIFMDNDLSTVAKAFLSPLSEGGAIKGTIKELRIMGDIAELARGMAHTRYMEGMSSSPFIKSGWDKTNNAFYNLNGLNLVTMTTKVMEATARGHTIIDRANKLASGKASKFETEFLARYGIDYGMARRLSKMPYETTPNGLIMPNSSQWTDDAAQEAFQTALRAGVANRIIMGTPADTPMIKNGVLYFRKSTAENFGLPIIEDPRVPGYVRYESGLMTLPFAFYSYTLGALTKITGNYAQGAVQNKAAHVAASLILGGMIVKVRTPSWAWDDMEPQDKAARALDFSGLAALHTDMAYRTLAMANELGFDISGSPIQPKFDSGVDPVGAGLSVLGAPVDYGYGVGSAVKDLMDGNTSEGAKGLINHMPFIGAMAFFGTIKDTLKAIVPSD